jgi:flagellar secretion chaperone FliS
MAPVQAHTYSQSQVTTSSPSELMVLLYRGAVRFAAKARLHIQNADVQSAHDELLRAQSIVLQIMGALRPSQNPVDVGLYALHNYVFEVLYRANRHKDVEMIDEALKHLRDQLSTWEEIALPKARHAAAGVISIDRRA